MVSFQVRDSATLLEWCALTTQLTPPLRQSLGKFAYMGISRMLSGHHSALARSYTTIGLDSGQQLLDRKLSSGPFPAPPLH